MNKFKKLSVVLLFSILVQPVLAFGLFEDLDINIFGGDKKANDVLWENGPNQYFKYDDDDQDEAEFGDNDHPVELDEREVENSLRLLRVKHERSTSLSILGIKSEGDTTVVEMVPMFNSEHAVFLSRVLVKGLKEASSKKDIIFVVEQSQKNMLGLTKDSFFTAGRVFYKDKKLNLILGDYNRPRNRGYETAYDPTNAGIVTYTFEHGQRSKKASGSNVFDEVIFEVPGIENKEYKTLRRDWFVIDVNLASDAYTISKKEEKDEEMLRKRKEIEEIFGQSFPTMVNAAPTIIQQEPVLVKSAEDRLVLLNDLKEKGLITEEEYVLKRRQVLEEL